VSHNKRLARTYSGESEGRDIVGWLNHKPFKDEVERLVSEVVGKRVNFRQEQERVIEVLRLYEQSRIEWETRKSEGVNSSARISKKKSASSKLKNRLRRYTFYPRFFPMGTLLSFAWLPTRPDHPDKYGEVSAIADLAKLAEKDLLGHLRECSCGKWIWARFSHQRFCSARCRERHFRSSESWKEHRRQKAREYYRLHKSGKVK
jgi:hypothetical protein